MQGYINLFFASLIVVIINQFGAGLTPLLFLIFSLTCAESIKNGSDQFKKKWGSLFLEFKNDRGLLSSQYYLIYFTRRVAYALSQIYLNSLPFVQGGINIFFSLMTLTHLLYYKPFKDGTILTTNIIGEINMFFVNILIYTFLWELSPWAQDKIEKSIIFSVIGSIFLQIMISMYCFFKFVKILWLKIEKIRALAFRERFENVMDEEITVTQKA